MNVETVNISLFICCAPEDIALARRLSYYFQQLKIPTRFPDEWNLSDSSIEASNKGLSLIAFIQEEITAKDYIVALVSEHFMSSDMLSEALKTIFSDAWASRGITVIPLLLTNRELPSFVKRGQYFSLLSTSEKDISDLAAKIEKVMLLDFSRLQSDTFMFLVRDLLVLQGFEDIQSLHSDIGVDMIGRFIRTDALGERVKETWLIETKLYHSDRVRVGTAYQLAKHLRLSGTVNKGLLVTNSQLTNAAHRIIVDIVAKGLGDIHVIEGVELKRLLLQHDNLIDKYFVKIMGA